eukprot:CAMPEP_0184480506 /NCGR_PEP_ID=MMETSP0113_2-20130426/2022_1 /TAXON_ID=91329 /ORGANISM="Norrisiella sphaerica, Strain BC52" /LENGTH=245 /DNA_ID=CAMNT_0026859045 /DNA_START=226 /DNA_END=963 /DNA_ORIENTATION=+
MAAKIAETTQRPTHVVDLRNHGKSPHVAAMDLNLMAEDLIRVMDSMDIKQAAVMGHSLGGKIALAASLLYPERLEQVVALDIAPVNYDAKAPESWRTIVHIVESMRSIDLSRISRRSDAEKMLKEKIKSPGIRRYALQNLSRSSDGKWSWRCNLDHISNALGQLSTFNVNGKEIDEDDDSLTACPVHIIRGETSSYVQDSFLTTTRKHFPHSEITTIADAGHWLHVDQPEKFLEVVTSYLASPNT